MNTEHYVKLPIHIQPKDHHDWTCFNNEPVPSEVFQYKNTYKMKRNIRSGTCKKSTWWKEEKKRKLRNEITWIFHAGHRHRSNMNTVSRNLTETHKHSKANSMCPKRDRNRNEIGSRLKTSKIGSRKQRNNIQLDSYLRASYVASGVSNTNKESGDEIGWGEQVWCLKSGEDGGMKSGCVAEFVYIGDAIPLETVKAKLRFNLRKD